MPPPVTRGGPGLFLATFPCPLGAGWFGGMEPWGRAMVVDGGALVTAVGAALEIVGEVTLGVRDGVGAVAGAVLFWFWPGPTIGRLSGWPPGG